MPWENVVVRTKGFSKNADPTGALFVARPTSDASDRTRKNFEGWKKAFDLLDMSTTGE
jgi:hypothetical protein